jgi:hypothetical protein
MGWACSTPRDGLEIGTGFRSGNPNGVTDVLETRACMGDQYRCYSRSYRSLVGCVDGIHLALEGVCGRLP